MRTWAIAVVSLILAVPAHGQSENLTDKVEDCEIVVFAAQLVSEKPEAEITMETASLILRGLTRICGFMSGDLRNEVSQAYMRRELSWDKAEAMFKIIGSAELAGPRYQGILRRARTTPR